MKYRTLLAAALLSGGLFAQDYLFLTGFSDSVGPSGPGDNSFPVSRFRDLNGDGTIDDASELFAFLTVSFNTRNLSGGELASYMSDMDWVQEGDNWAFYIADSADGRITRGVDSNNNGVLDPNEVTEFFDFQSAFSPDGIAAWHDSATGRTRVYVAQDDSASPFGRGIHRLVDLNGDGDAKDAGEQVAFVSAAANLSVQGTSGTVQLVSHLWEQVHTLADGTVIAYSRASSSGTVTPNPDQYCWYAFTDNNGTASASVFFNPTQLNGIPAYPDFAAGGIFPRWDARRASDNKDWSDIQYFAQGETDSFGITSYYFTASYNADPTFFTVNQNGVSVDGLVYRWRDLNQNYRIDANEINLFANMSGVPITVGSTTIPNFTIAGPTGTIQRIDRRIFGMKATDGAVHICWSDSGKRVFELQDLNGNGYIETGPEARLSYEYSNATNPVYSAAFGPFIKDFSAFPRGLMPGPFPPGIIPYGSGCPLNGNGLSPVNEATGGAPQVGNAAFAFGAQRLLPNQPTAYVAISLARQTPAIPLPSPPFPSGCDVHVDLGAGFLGTFGPFSSDADGVVTAPVPIPNDPSLAGFSLFAQWAVFEFGTPGRLVLSNGLEVTVQP